MHQFFTQRYKKKKEIDAPSFYICWQIVSCLIYVDNANVKKV